MSVVHCSNCCHCLHLQPPRSIRNLRCICNDQKQKEIKKSVWYEQCKFICLPCIIIRHRWRWLLLTLQLTLPSSLHLFGVFASMKGSVVGSIVKSIVSTSCESWRQSNWIFLIILYLYYFFLNFSIVNRIQHQYEAEECQYN